MIKRYLAEFKEFAVKGSVLDLAVGVVIGAAFGKIIDSLVKDIIMPLLGIILGGIDFTEISFVFKNAEVTIGMFLQALLNFIIVAGALFVFIKIINKVKREQPKSEAPITPATDEVKILTEIRDILKK